MKLVNTKTGEEIKVGDTVKTFRGDDVTVTGFTERRVYVRLAASEATAEYFHSVIGAEVQS